MTCLDCRRHRSCRRGGSGRSCGHCGPHVTSDRSRGVGQCRWHRLCDSLSPHLCPSLSLFPSLAHPSAASPSLTVSFLLQAFVYRLSPLPHTPLYFNCLNLPVSLSLSLFISLSLYSLPLSLPSSVSPSSHPPAVSVLEHTVSSR
jgi:hypothetical protein